MITRVEMQKLSWTMEEGKIVRWLRQEGDSVSKGDEILEVETEKVNVALEAPASGILRKKLCNEGDTVPVGEMIGIIADANEDIQSVVVQTGTKQPQRTTALSSQVSASETAPSRVQPAAATSEIVASPRARRLAREKGIDLSRVKGTGPGGRIVEEDILSLGEVKKEPSFPFTVLNTIEITGQRRVVADRMLTSLQSKAQITLTTEVDMTEVKRFREKLNAQKDKAEVTYNDLIIRAVAEQLRDHRIFNALLIQNQVKVVGEINIGLAVATDDGLVVPVVKNADKLSLEEIAQKTSDIVERARTKRLSVSDVSDGTFTITNLGMYDIDVNTAIINPPQCAILAVGRIVEKPVILQGKVASRHMMTMSFTFDHRITDGVPAAKFLRDLKVSLEAEAGRLANP